MSKRCEHGISDMLPCEKCEASTLAEAAKVATDKPFEMYMLRNAIGEAMTTIVNYELFKDPETGKQVDGKSMFLFLFAMAKHGWKPLANVWAGDKLLAKESGLSRNYIAVLKRAACAAGLILDAGKVHHKTQTDTYTMDIEFIADFIQRAVLPVPESLKGFRPDPKGDALEEIAQYAADDADEHDEVLDPAFDPMSTGSADHEADTGVRVDLTGEPTTPLAKYCRGCSQPRCEWNSNYCADCLRTVREEGAILGGAPLGVN
jgi:hypothetical protein